MDTVKVVVFVVLTRIFNKETIVEARCIGKISPSELAVEYGKDLMLRCSLGDGCDEGLNSSHIYVAHIDRPIPKEHIQILSSKEIELRLPKVTFEARGSYECILNTSQGNVYLGYNRVLIVYKEKPANIRCFVYDQKSERLNCTWQYPILFMKQLIINISWRTGGDWRDFCRHNVTWALGDSTYVSCEWRAAYKRGYNFTLALTLKNKMSSEKAEPMVYNLLAEDRTKIVKLDKVKQVIIKSITSDTMHLSWRYHNNSNTRYIFSVTYSSEWDIEPRNITVLSSQNSSITHTVELNVPGLIPNTNYSFTIVSQPDVSGAYYWSDAKTVYIITPSDVPKKAPLIPPGGFVCEDDGCQTIRLYWQALPERDHHGILMGYRIMYKTRVININDSHQYSAKIELNPGSGPHVFCLYSLNNVGQSLECSTLRIDNIDALPAVPVSLGVKPVEDNSAAIMWKKPPSVEHTAGFVVYVCNKNIKGTCTGSLYYLEVSPPKREFLLDLSLFGLALDTANIGIATVAMRPNTTTTSSYSGIEWADCFFQVDSEYPAVSPEVTVFDVGVQMATVSWKKLTCLESRGWVWNYVLYYCESNTCNATVAKTYIHHWRDRVTTKLTNLYPYTRYDVWAVANTSNVDIKGDLKKFTFRTEPLAPPVNVTWDDGNNLSFTCPALAYTLSSQIVVQYQDRQGSEVMKHKPCGHKTSTFVNFDCTHRGVEGFQVEVSLVTDSHPSSPSVPVTVCHKKAMPSGIITVIVIACIVGGMALLVVMYFAIRFWTDECQRVPDNFQYAGEIEGFVRPHDGDDYNTSSAGRSVVSGSKTAQMSNGWSTSSKKPMLENEFANGENFLSDGYVKVHTKPEEDTWGSRLARELLTSDHTQQEQLTMLYAENLHLNNIESNTASLEDTSNSCAYVTEEQALKQHGNFQSYLGDRLHSNSSRDETECASSVFLCSENIRCDVRFDFMGNGEKTTNLKETNPTSNDKFRRVGIVNNTLMTPVSDVTTSLSPNRVMLLHSPIETDSGYDHDSASSCEEVSPRTDLSPPDVGATFNSTMAPKKKTQDYDNVTDDPDLQEPRVKHCSRDVTTLITDTSPGVEAIFNFTTTPKQSTQDYDNVPDPIDLQDPRVNNGSRTDASPAYVHIGRIHTTKNSNLPDPCRRTGSWEDATPTEGITSTDVGRPFSTGRAPKTRPHESYSTTDNLGIIPIKEPRVLGHSGYISPQDISYTLR